MLFLVKLHQKRRASCLSSTLCPLPPVPTSEKYISLFLEVETQEESDTPLKTYLKKESLVNGRIKDSAIETKEKPALQGKLNAWICAVNEYETYPKI